MNPRIAIPTITIGLIILATSIGAFERGPQGVSPGAVDRLAGVGSTCPTFTWESVSEAQRYELVVYRVDPATMNANSLRFTPENEVLYTSISGLASAWTPESSDSFLAGESYVWFVRAVADAETGEGSEWSEPRFFEVAAAPTGEELAQAIEVIRRWEAAAGGGALTLSAAADADAVPAAVPDAAAVSGAGTGTDADAGSAAPKSVITGTAAIRGEQPDLSGETYGVVGTSASPDGAGIGAANTAGGPDLVLDGAVPAEISEAGVDRPSASPQTFSFTNTGGGGMTLDVDGVEVLTTASSIDADTLDGTDGADYSTDVETAALVATHAASADHDGRYYTEAELSSPGGAELVHWDNLGGVPPGFADGIDNDTTYNFGSGLTMDGGQVAVDPTVFVPSISTIDINPQVSVVGKYNSIAIGNDGLGLISYREEIPSYDLKVAHCNDIPCTSATISTLDGVGSNSGWYTSIAIGNDGLGLISYYDSTSLTLKTAHCNDVPCTSATINTLDGTGGAVSNTSITIGTDNLALISYYDNVNDDLKVAKCHDEVCSSATLSTLDSSGDVGRDSSITIGPLDLGVISYRDESNGALKLAQCGNLSCTSASISTIDSNSSPGVGYYSSIAMGADGLTLISYFDGYDDELKVAHCEDVLCSSTTTSVLQVGSIGYVSLAIADDGFGLISYFDSDEQALKVAHCRDAACTSATTRTVASVYVWHTSMALGSDGRGIISYYDSSNYALKVAHLPYGY